jgi:flagellar biosynthesis/type III secretory pathway ATPase
LFPECPVVVIYPTDGGGLRRMESPAGIMSFARKFTVKGIQGAISNVSFTRWIWAQRILPRNNCNRRPVIRTKL